MQDHNSIGVDGVIDAIGYFPTGKVLMLGRFRSWRPTPGKSPINSTDAAMRSATVAAPFMLR